MYSNLCVYLLHVIDGVGTPADRHLKLTVRSTAMSIASIGGMVIVAGTVWTDREKGYVQTHLIESSVGTVL